MNPRLRRIVRHALVAGLLVSGVACKEIGPPPPPPPPPPVHDRTGTMTARIDGAPWAAATLGDSVLAFVNLVDADSTLHWPARLMLFGVSINGLSSSSLMAYVTVTGAPGPANFSLGAEPNLGGEGTPTPDGGFDPAIFHTDDLHAGQLSISTLDLKNWRAKGTFSCHLVRDDGATMEVTDGQFDLPMDHNGQRPTMASLARTARLMMGRPMP